MQIKLILVTVFLFPILHSCSHHSIPRSIQYPDYSVQQPDYADLKLWAAHPWKWDPSDSTPKALFASFTRDTIADVFFLHPTTLTETEKYENNASLSDAILNYKTDYSTILYQASAFNAKARVFAPRYRQAHYRTFFLNDSSQEAKYFDTAYSDIKKAFEYYLLHYNNGRPIIIAAHSQGTLHAGRLIKEFFENKPLQKKLVCAYLIGMPVSETYFTALPPCRNTNDCGCFVSWRTFRKNYTDTLFVAKEKFKAIVTNPLTWKTDSIYAGRNLNKGGLLKNFEKIKRSVVDAQVHGNVLWTCKPKFFGNIFLTTKNYHIGDINLFYTNIRENVIERITAFQHKN